MSPEELLEQFRSDVQDTVKPYLWSDDEAYRYMQAAYRRFVRETGGVADFNTAEVCEVEFSAADQFIDLHPSILKIARASLKSDGSKVEIKNITDMDTARGEADYGGIAPIDLDATGYVRYLVIGEKRNVGRLVYVPTVADTLRLNVYRMPLGEAKDGFEDVEEDHHTYLSLWMQYLAYSKPDPDTYDSRRAEIQKKEFLIYCQDVVLQWEKYKTKVRTVNYGGL